MRKATDKITGNIGKALHRIPPLAMLLGSSAFGLAGMLAAIWLAMQIHVPLANFSVDAASDAFFMNSQHESNSRVSSFGIGYQRYLPVESNMLVEDMDALADYAEENHFLEVQDTLAQAMRTGELVVQLSDGRSVSIPTQRRAVNELPFMFWFQLACGYLAWIIGIAVWAYSRDRNAAFPLAMMGLGLAISAWSAAVYSTRELAMDGAWFHVLRLCNSTGAMFFNCWMAALFWRYPTRLQGADYSGVFAILSVLFVCLADSMQLGSSHNTTYFIPFFVVFGSSMLFALRQWFASSSDPVARSAFIWLLLSMFVGTLLFTGLSILPFIFAHAPAIGSQGMMFGALVLVHIGLALGIVRYRLFDIGRWWFAIWSWLLGGTLVVALDFLLLSLWAWPQSLALPATMLIAGFIYFPLRQWLWHRITRHSEPDHSVYYSRLAALCSEPEHPVRLRENWSDLLSEMFAPMEISFQHVISDGAEMLEHGGLMQVAALDADGTLLLRHPARGKRLFNNQDTQLAEHYLHMGRRMLAEVRERQNATSMERHRILNDLHDELGGTLLQLVYQSSGSPSQSLARSAMEDMRELVRFGHEESIELGEALADIRSQIASQFEVAGLQMTWHAELTDDVPILGNQLLQLKRIFKEAVTNVLLHARARHVHISFKLQSGELCMQVADDGIGMPENAGKGNGVASMRQRTDKLGGNIEWTTSDKGGCMVSLHFKLQ